MKHLILVIILAVMLAGCSKDEDTVAPVENDSFITGNWETFLYTTTGGDYDSLSVKIDLTGKDNKFTGNGEVLYSCMKNNTTSRYTFKDDAAGSYNEDELKINLVSELSGNSYTFTGSRDLSLSNTTRYIGQVKLILYSDTVSFNDVTIFKH